MDSREGKTANGKIDSIDDNSGKSDHLIFLKNSFRIKQRP